MFFFFPVERVSLHRRLPRATKCWCGRQWTMYPCGFVWCVCSEMPQTHVKFDPHTSDVIIIAWSSSTPPRQSMVSQVKKPISFSTWWYVLCFFIWGEARNLNKPFLKTKIWKCERFYLFFKGIHSRSPNRTWLEKSPCTVELDWKKNEK